MVASGAGLDGRMHDAVMILKIKRTVVAFESHIAEEHVARGEIINYKSRKCAASDCLHVIFCSYLYLMLVCQI